MSSPVVSVGPYTPLLQVAMLLRETGFGGLPVVLQEELIGIVTMKDLLYRQELGTRRRTDAWWWRIVGGGGASIGEGRARRARHVMTRRVIVVQPETPLHAIGDLFDQYRIGRVPVLRNGRMVGIVATADLLKALPPGSWLRACRSAGAPQTRPKVSDSR